MESLSLNLIDRLIDTFKDNKQFNYDYDKNYFYASLNPESNPYSVNCLIKWIKNIEENERIIALDFDKIEKDLQQLLQKYRTVYSQCLIETRCFCVFESGKSKRFPFLPVPSFFQRGY